MSEDYLKPNHIYNGKYQDLLPKVKKKSVQLLLTDPPYFVNIQKSLKTNSKTVNTEDWDTPKTIEERREIFYQIFTDLDDTDVMADNSVLILFNTKDFLMQILMQKKSEKCIGSGSNLRTKI
ncbi:hypothetical protein [Lactiplantibacillus plantarum]|uniref:hypothetical protein n=1 Tax=Lactiplantibacillus plantarum TaxID=1590 RepID=UPI001959088A|nr:hypothetical protein [Lactiplantibacillus plantarum]QRQ96742.1 hypothetical protein Lp900_00501 [Lactiplantibacillus plantarum]